MSRQNASTPPGDDQAAVDDDAARSERRVRAWPQSVTEVARWCRAARIEPIPAQDVKGANEHERKQLAALGGIAAAMARRSNPLIDFSTLPIAVQRWLKMAPIPPSKLVEDLCQDFNDNQDPLALVYERIVSGPRRRMLGTFFTPAPVLIYMRDLVKELPKAPRVVADPGAGVGAFSAASLDWWRKAEIHAVDVNLVTLGLLAIRPRAVLAAGDQHAGRLRIRHEDFLEWLTNRWTELDGPRLILGNPPYTRHQLLTASEKEAARTASGELSPGARAGLSTYFLAASLSALGTGDSLCLLLPANWLEADYARTVRKKIWESSKREVQLHLFPNDLNVFPGTQVAPMVVFIGPRRRTEQSFKFFGVEGSVEDGFRRSSPHDIVRSGPTPPTFSPTRLLASSRTERASGVRGTVPLASVAIVRRGIATGANSFFLRTDEERKALPDDACIPAISRLRLLQGDVLDKRSHSLLSQTGARCWLLNLNEAKVQDPRLQEIINIAEKDDIHKGYLCKQRNPWYSLEKIVPPDILVGPMGKTNFRIVVNTIGAIPTNTLYGLRLRRRDEKTIHPKIVALADWLKGEGGQRSLRAAARAHHGDGLVKLEPGALGSVQVPSDLF